MIRHTVLGLEIRETLRQPLTWLVLCVLLIAMLAGAAVGVNRVANQQATLEQAQRQEAAAIAAAENAWRKFSVPADYELSAFRDPTDAAGYMNSFLTVFAVNPPSPLAALAAGQSDLQPTVIRVNFGNPFPDTAYELKSPRILALGGFGLGFVLVYLVPLGLIALGGTRIAWEQDSGVLRLIAAQPTTPLRVAAAKFGALAIVVTPVIVGGSLFALWIAGGISAAVPAASLAVLGALIGLYCLFWIALCAATTSLWRGAVTSLAALVIGWAAMTVLIPALGTLMLNLAQPAPSRIAYVDESRMAAARIAGSGDAGPVWFATRPDLVRINPEAANSSQVARFARDDLTRSYLLDSRREFAAHTRQAEDNTAFIRLLSPALVLDGALQELAGADTRSHLQFLAFADAYTEALRRWFQPRIVATVGEPPRCEACPGRLNFDAYDEVPRYQPAPAGHSAAGQHLSLLYLLVAGLAIGLFAALRFRSWPVE